MRALEPGVRAKVYPALMSRAMAWFRWSALATVLMGMRYFFSMLITDARNSGDSGLALRWFGWWVLVWVVAYEGIYFFQLPAKGIRDSVWVRAVGIGALVIAASWIVMALNGGEHVSNGHLAISVGWRAGVDDAAKYVGRGVAGAKEIDCVDAGGHGAGDADAG